MTETQQAFEDYVNELEAQLAAAEVTGALGDDDRRQLNALTESYRSRVAAAEDEAAARRLLEDFKRASARFGQGAAMP